MEKKTEKILLGLAKQLLVKSEYDSSRRLKFIF